MTGPEVGVNDDGHVSTTWDKTNPQREDLPLEEHTQYAVSAAAHVACYDRGELHRDTLTSLVALGLRERDRAFRDFQKKGGGGKGMTRRDHAIFHGRLDVQDVQDAVIRGDLGPAKGTH